jgi:oligopeptide transport system permease protein
VGRYVVRRLLQMIPVFIGAPFITSLWGPPRGARGAPPRGDGPPPPPPAARLRAEFNLDRPLWQQYLLYLGNIFSGDFGTAFNGEPVWDLMTRAFPISFRLMLVALAFEIVIGITLGVITGLRRGRSIDTSVLMMTLIVIAIPTFVLGTTLQFFLGVKLDWINPAVSPEAPFRELIVPGLIIAMVSLAYVTRLTRTSIVENARADYIRTAVAKGLPRRRITVRHLLRNSLIPVVTYLGADIGTLMAGAIVTERIFNIQGVGYQLYQGIFRQNAPTVVGFVTVLVLIFLLANLLVDLLYAVLDPRIRYA